MYISKNILTEIIVVKVSNVKCPPEVEKGGFGQVDASIHSGRIRS